MQPRPANARHSATEAVAHRGRRLGHRVLVPLRARAVSITATECHFGRSAASTPRFCVGRKPARRVAPSRVWHVFSSQHTLGALAATRAVAVDNLSFRQRASASKHARRPHRRMEDSPVKERIKVGVRLRLEPRGRGELRDGHAQYPSRSLEVPASVIDHVADKSSADHHGVRVRLAGRADVAAAGKKITRSSRTARRCRRPASRCSDPEPERRPAARPAVRALRRSTAGDRRRPRRAPTRAGDVLARPQRAATELFADARLGAGARRPGRLCRAPVHRALLVPPARRAVAFDRHAFEVAVEATPAPWVGVDATSGADASGTDVVLGVTVRRVAATVGGGRAAGGRRRRARASSSSASSSPRWSELQREVLAIGDIYDFDLGDRKRLADVKKPGVPGQPRSIRVRVHLAVAPRPVRRRRRVGKAALAAEIPGASTICVTASRSPVGSRPRPTR